MSDYSIVTGYGDIASSGVNPNIAPMFIANRLRACDFVGFRLRWDNVPPLGFGCSSQLRHVITVWGDDGPDSTDPVTEDPIWIKVTDSDDKAEQRETQDVMEYSYFEPVSDNWYLQYPDEFSAPYPYIMLLTTLAEPQECSNNESGQVVATQNVHDYAFGLRYHVHLNGTGTTPWICDYSLSLDPPVLDKPQVVRIHESDSHEYLIVEWHFMPGEAIPLGGSLTLATELDIPNATSGTVTYSDIEWFSPSGDPEPAMTWGECDEGVKIREKNTVKQTTYSSGAHGLEMLMWQKEDNIEINGWEVVFDDHFNSENANTTSVRDDQPEPAHSQLATFNTSNSNCPETDDPDNGMHAVFARTEFDEVIASGETVAENDEVEVDSTFWLTCHNTQRNRFEWYQRSKSSTQKAAPFHGWELDWPSEYGGSFHHELRIVNDDELEPLDVRGLQYIVSPIYYTDLALVDFTGATTVSNFQLAPGDPPKVIDIVTPGAGIGSHIYFRYTVFWNDEPVLQKTADHPIECESTMVGDFTCDGQVNLDDVAAFVDALLIPTPLTITIGDMNGDDFLNGLDTAFFVEAILAP